MAGESNKVKARLANLNASLGELESLLEPVLAQSLPETIIGLEPLQQARLQTVLPYLIYDLIFIYLKTKGADPKCHAVVSELDRVRQYFEKIAHVENPPIRRTEVDKDAAGRFIKHAITQAISKTTTDSQPMSPPPPSSFVPVKVTTKMVARAQYERALERERQVEEEAEEVVLEVYDEPGSDSSDDSGDSSSPANKKASPSPVIGQVAAQYLKRRRSPMDPFAGYGEDSGMTATGSSAKKPRGSQSGKASDSVQSPQVSVDSRAASAVSSNRKLRKKKKTNKNRDK